MKAATKISALQPPATATATVAENATRQKIIDAALVCLDRWGLEKTSLHDIAREAGVTRPTVYSYFTNRDEVVQAAMIQGGQRFGLKLLNHINQFSTPRHRLLEAVLFAYKNMPQEPYLKLVKNAGMAHMINEQAITSAEGREICRSLFQEILQHDKKYQKELDEIVEVTTRFLLSLLLVEGAIKRNDKQMREFLEKRLLPATGVV
jgi:AcrR family transcriptional regulator